MLTKINLPYGALTVLFLSTEVLIALHVNDLVIRPFLGDFLATILIYCFCKTLDPSSEPANFAYSLSLGVECLQATPFLSFSGLDRYPLAVVVMGNHFSWVDVGMYTLAFAGLKVLEKRRQKVTAPEEHPSIVKKIWSDPDCLLLLFAAASREFAYHKKVDWLFFTGKLPADPLGRMFSTLSYSQKILFSSSSSAQKTLKNMQAIHQQVETNRGEKIPDWAYKDVLYLLIDYSLRVGTWAYGSIPLQHKEELYQTFKEVGEGMGITALPSDYLGWSEEREKFLDLHYEESRYTELLFAAYRRQLGAFRYALLLSVQKEFVPQVTPSLVTPSFLAIYKPLRKVWPISRLKYLLLPKSYAQQLRRMGTTVV